MIKNLTAPFLFFLLFCILISSCEKDDICLVETPSSPRLVVRLYDKDNRSAFKAANNIIIHGVGQEEPLMTLNTDSLTIPLKTQEAFTQYAFILPSSTASLTFADTLQFNYRRYDKYLNPISFPTNTPVWLESFEILIDTVSNEQQSHLAIYH